MALPTKGSKTISVDNIRYRWVVTPQDGCILLVVQQRVARRARAGKLLVTSDYEPTFGRDPDPVRRGIAINVGAMTLAITPEFVRRAIQFGRTCGWSTSQLELTYVRGQFARKVGDGAKR